MSLLPSRVRLAARRLEPRPSWRPWHPDKGWQTVGPYVHGSPSPVVELHYDPLPDWNEGPYRQDVPK